MADPPPRRAAVRGVAGRGGRRLAPPLAQQGEDLTTTELPSTEALWRVYVQGLALANQVAVDGETRLTLNAALALSGEPHVELNVAVIGGGDDAADRLREFVECMRSRGVAGYVGLAQSLAARLGPVARDLGLVRGPRTPLMIRRRAPITRCEGPYVLERVEDETGRCAVVAVTAEAFDVPVEQTDRAMGPASLELPGIDMFVARADGLPISCAVTTRVGPYVGFWDMATRPSWQGRGAGRAVLGHALDFHAPDAELYYLTASDSGRRLYEPCGFTVVDPGPSWIVMPEAGHGDTRAATSREESD